MKLLIVIALSFAMTGCMATYRDFPVNALGQKPNPGACDTLYYNIKKFDILDMGGYNALRNTFRGADLCRQMTPVETAPAKGLYVEVETKWKPMTIPALVFGYLSLTTFTIIPAWSTQDGYTIRYNVYMDGQKLDTYNYEITRKAGLWIGLLPLAWINLLTYSEEDAFEATVHQFFRDAHPHLAARFPS